MLVTGGAGFIGSHIIARLLSDGHDVTCLDSFDPYYDPAVKRQNITPFLSYDGFTLLEGDINDRQLLTQALDGCDYVDAGVRKVINASSSSLIEERE